MIVTTFSPSGYRQYGQRFVETYKEYCKYPLIIYVEDDLKIPGIEVRNLYSIPGCKKFLDIVKDVKVEHYRMNVNKFCRKVFAIYDASRFERFAFIGADTIFHKEIPDTFLDDMLKDVYLAYLGRKIMHSETDFIAFNTSHKASNLFMSLFLGMYTTGAFQDLKYWCDSDVFDHVRKLLSLPENNLNICGDENHPFVNSILGEYMTHLKGPQRKMMGKCFDHDYLDKRRIQV